MPSAFWINVVPLERPNVRVGTDGPPVLSRRLLVSAGACLACLVPLAAKGREMPAAEQFIQELGLQTIGVLNRTGVDEAARTSRMAQLLEKAVDFEAVARIVLGRNWQRVYRSTILRHRSALKRPWAWP